MRQRFAQVRDLFGCDGGVGPKVFGQGFKPSEFLVEAARGWG